MSFWRCDIIFKELIHTGLGDCGEGIIRHAIANNIINKGVLKPINTDAHRPLSFARKLSDAPAFISVRNPFCWYLSRWIHRLRNHKYYCGFSDWFFDEKPCMMDMWNYYTKPEGIPFEQVIRFENVEDDFARILPDICPRFTPEMVHSWFPAAFTQWSRRTQSESIEQWMRKELYTVEIYRIVMKQDKWILDTWDYNFDQYYKSHKGHLG